MTVEELTEAIKTSGLDYWEVAIAVSKALESQFSDKFDYGSVEDIKHNAAFMQFYLSAKQFKD